MNDARRHHEVMVRLNDTELARLDQIRPPGIARAVYLRSLLRQPLPEGIANRRSHVQGRIPISIGTGGPISLG